MEQGSGGPEQGGGIFWKVIGALIFILFVILGIKFFYDKSKEEQQEEDSEEETNKKSNDDDGQDHN